MITEAQLRCARAALNWSAERLAKEAGLSSKTVRRMEALDEVPSGTVDTQIALKSALEGAGIEFIGTPDDGPGIRIRQPTPHPR